MKVGRDFFGSFTQADIPFQHIIPAMKRSVLRGVSIVFSGVIALGAKASDSEYWKLALTFGAECRGDVSAGVTHVVANQVSNA